MFPRDSLFVCSEKQKPTSLHFFCFMSWYNLDNIMNIIECLAFVVKSCPKNLTHNSRFTRKTASIKPGMWKSWIILISCAHPQADQHIKCVSVRLQK